jgi:hypothetical protein
VTLENWRIVLCFRCLHYTTYPVIISACFQFSTFNRCFVIYCTYVQYFVMNDLLDKYFQLCPWFFMFLLLVFGWQ